MEQEPVQNPGTRVAGGAQPRPAEVSSAPTRMCVTRGLGVGRTPGPAGHGTERQRRHCRGTRPARTQGLERLESPVGLGSTAPPPGGEGSKVGGSWAPLQRSLLPWEPRRDSFYIFFTKKSKHLAYISIVVRP